MTDKPEPTENEVDPKVETAPELKTRRDFLRSLGRWSAIIIGGATLGGIVESTDAAGWVNGGGGGWVNARGGGGGGWVNKSGGGATWVNRSGGWINGAVGGGGGAWVNARGGGGGASWVNRH